MAKAHRPPQWKRLASLLWDLICLFNPVLDAARKIWKWVCDEADGIRQGWHLFLIVAILVATVFFYFGHEFQIFYDRPNRYTQRVWRPPHLQKGMDKVLISFGNFQNIFDVTNLLATGGANFTLPARMLPWYPGGKDLPLFKVRIVNNTICLDLDVPTRSRPVQIRTNQINDLAAGWDWNCNATNLEIVNSQILSVFQENYEFPCSIKIKGFIRSGKVVASVSDQNETPQCGIVMDDIPAGIDYPGNVALNQIFAFPGDIYPGVLFAK